jgi:hypothetical protein
MTKMDETLMMKIFCAWQPVCHCHFYHCVWASSLVLMNDLGPHYNDGLRLSGLGFLFGIVQVLHYPCIPSLYLIVYQFSGYHQMTFDQILTLTYAALLVHNVEYAWVNPLLLHPGVLTIHSSLSHVVCSLCSPVCQRVVQNHQVVLQQRKT